MRRNIEDYRPDPASVAAAAAANEKPRVSFLGAQQDTALTRRVIGGVAASALLLAASFFLVG